MTTSADPDSEPTARRQLSGRPESAEIAETQCHELARRSVIEHTEALLDEALNETFPASDPVAITTRNHTSK
ncbi:MAG: hypothetical protein ABI082_04195 [Dokdonella sp.]